MKEDFIIGLIVGIIIAIVLIGYFEYERQRKPRFITIEHAKAYGCSTLMKNPNACDEVPTTSIIIENFDADGDGKKDSADTFFALCKYHLGIDTDSECKKLCGCSFCSQDNSLLCDRSCNSDNDCELSCGCGCISNSEECIYAGIVCEAPGPYEECKCVNNECKYFNPPP